MNRNVLSEWCEKNVFPTIQSSGQKAVLVLHRAAYHTVLGEEDRGTVQSWNKARLILAIERWRGAPNSWNDD